MMYAFWRMRSNPSPNYRRYINARAYEFLKNEYINSLRENLKIKQAGVNNSNFGKHWYTNRNTGETNMFKCKPNECWVLGKNLFRGESSKINYTKLNQKFFIRKMWDKYHSENWTCVSNFGEVNNIIELRRKFRRWIPYFKKISDKTNHNRFDFPSNKNLIGVYE